MSSAPALAIGGWLGIKVLRLRNGAIAALRPMLEGWIAKFLPDGRIVGVVDGKLTLAQVIRENNSVRLGATEVIADAAKSGLVAVSVVNDRVAWRGPTRSIHIAPVSDMDDVVEVRPKPTGGILEPLFALSPNGKYLAVSDDTIRLFDPKTGELIHDFGRESDGITRSTFAFSPDGKQMMCYSGFDHMLFDLENKQLVSRIPVNGVRPGAAWSPDGSILAFAIDDETIQLCNAKSLEELARLRSPDKLGIHSIHFNQDGSALLASVAHHDICRWDLQNLRAELDQLGLDW